MTILPLLDKLQELGIRVESIGDKLKINAPEGILTPPLINEIKGKKEELIKFLQKSTEDHAEYKKIESVEEREYYKPSSAQNRIYFLQLMDLNSTAYNLRQISPLNGHVDSKKLEDIFKKLIERHGSLRTSFIMVNDQMAQRVQTNWDFELEYYDVSQAETEVKVEEVLRNFVRPFDLSKAPLLRVGLIRKRDQRHIIIAEMHHIISDGMSNEILIKEFISMYKGDRLAPSRLQYKDYASWQNRRKQEGILKHQEDFWLKEYQGEVPILNLPTDFSRGLVQSFKGGVLSFYTSPEETDALKNLSLEQGFTLYTILLAVINVLMFKLSDQEDIVIGTPTTGRNHADLMGIIGMFVNTLAIRNFPTVDKTFKFLLEEVNIRTLQAFENQDYQFEDIVERLAVPRDTARNPLFDVMFIWQNIIDNKKAIPAEINTERDSTSIPDIFTLSKFDLSFSAMEVGGGVFWEISYCAALFRKETILRFIRYFKKIISSVLRNPNLKISAIEILSEEEKNQVLYNFNTVEPGFSWNNTIPCLFEDQAKRSPDHTALHGCGIAWIQGEEGKKKEAPFGQFVNAFGEIQLTYSLLNEESNRLAYTLLEKDVRPDTIVGIMIERSVEMIIGIMGILKAGGAYLPVDPGYPEDRINYMLADSGAKLLVSGRNDLKREHRPVPILDLIHVIHGESGIQEPGMRQNNNTETGRTGRCPVPTYSPTIGQQPPANSLAYIIYTSGSTGKPKSVMVEQGSVVDLLFAMHRRYPLREQDAYLLKTSYLFDVSVTELFGWFLEGGRLAVLEPGGEKDPAAILDMIAREGVTHINFVPSMFHVFVKMLGPQEVVKLAGLKYIFLAGEALLPAAVNHFRSLNTSIAIENIYGPTEASVYASWYSISDWDGEGAISIGKPLPNVILHILGKCNNLQPIGVVGELCIGGTGLARGYLNRPALTAEKFIESYFYRSDRTYSRLYKTGDLARWLSDGNIEFLGRIDHQVKIRGFRIELEEIENCLLRISDVKEAIVLSREEERGDKYICAYFVSDSEYGISELREYLSKELPDFMIPSHFVRLEKIPLSPNGKVNRKALPGPERTAGKSYIAPRDEVETKLVEIWSEVLGRDALHATQLQSAIGIDDNFFQLGGHSLKATILVSKIHKEFEVTVPLSVIFKTPRIEALAGYIKGKNKDIYMPIQSVEKKEYYPLSLAQKRLYILQHMQLDGTAYNMPQFIPLKMETHLTRIESTFKKLIARHENFRTSFYMVNDEPVQQVHEDGPFEIVHHHVTIDGAVPVPDSFVHPFDLARAPLLRVGLVEPIGGGRGTEDRQGHTLLMVDMHHIISDEVSHGVLIKDFLALYEGEYLLPMRIQYKDFSQWQNGEKEKEKIKHQVRYWLKEFPGEIPVLELPTDYPRPVVQSFEGNSVNFEITGEETQGLKTMALTGSSTLFMVLAAIVNILLAKLSGQEDIIIGTPIAGRRHSDLEKIIGMFVNTLSLRNYPTGERTFEEFLRDVKERALKAFENQEYPFEELVNQLSLKRDIGRNPLFDVMFAIQNMSTVSAGQDEDTEIENSRLLQHDSPNESENIFQIAKFDFTLTAVERGRSIFFSIQYCTKLFKKETIERFIAYFKKIVSVTVKYPGIKISEIEIISGEEKNRLLYEFNDTEADYPNNKTLHRLFEEQVERSPDNIAVHGCMIAWMQGEEEKNEEAPFGQFVNAFGEMQLSYGLLNEESNRLAYTLLEKGVKPDTIVGIMIERSVEMMIGIMGILKAGGAYLPIDPEYPEGRIYYMLADTNASALITTHNSAKDDEKARRWEGERILLEEILHSPKSSSHPLSFLPSYLQNSSKLSPASSSLAYVIYTSGSTGKPKSVMLEHRNAANTITWFIDIYKVRSDVRILQISDYTFDASVNQIFGSLISGASLYIVSKEIRADIEELQDYIIYHRINIINFVPTLLKELLGYGDKLECLHRVISGAEELNEATKEAIIGKGYRLFNQYGPTETAIDALALECSSSEVVSLGKPIFNVKVYILDKYEKVLPIGVAGELCISGSGVARGYLNRLELTAKKFVISPRPSNDRSNKFFPNHRLYKTGDLACWLADGNIEFLGRIDYQVKIRGYRIELGEIENRLLEVNGIKEAVVLVREEDGEDKYICAYFVSDRTYGISELREYLAKKLPNYMIPGHFERLEKIPLTPNGKVNRKALPEPKRATGESYIAPRNEVETKLVKIWSEVLGRDALHASQLQSSVGIDDNFFHLGGHSLKATILAAKIHKELNVILPLVELFKTPTIKGLAEYLSRILEDNFISLEAVEKKEYYPLSSTQKRLYLIQERDLEGITYNLPEIYISEDEIDKDRLTGTFKKMIERHESLRTSFELISGYPMQHIHDHAEFEIEYDSATEYTGGTKKTLFGPKSYIDSFIRPFDLSIAPLIHVGLIKEENKHILMIDMHHIISDGVSHGILVKDFIALYAGEKLPALRLHYKDFSQWQNNLIRSGEMKKQEQYWLKEFAGDIPILNLPMDYNRPGTQSFEGDGLQFEISSSESDILRDFSKNELATLFMVLLAIYNVLLSKLSGQVDIIVGVGTAGRRHADLDKIIGMFVNTLALRNYPGENKTFKEFLREVRDRTLQAFENQDYLFEDLVEKVVKKRDLSRNPLFDTVFMVRNLGDEAIDSSMIDKFTSTLRAYGYKTNISQFDMLWICTEGSEGLRFSVTYCAKLFKKETIERYISYFKKIVSKVTGNLEIKIKDILIPIDLLRSQSYDDEMELGF